MGTSTSNHGQSGKTPLVPSWLDDNDADQQPEQPQQGDPKRFSASRSNFTRYVNSGGSGSGSLHRATSNYIRRSLGEHIMQLLDWGQRETVQSVCFPYSIVSLIEEWWKQADSISLGT